MSDYDPPEPKEPIDYTGYKILAILLPVLLFFMLLGKSDIGLTACIVLGTVILTVKIRWILRKHPWFWPTIAVILVLHVPLVLAVRWPQGNGPTLGYTMPFGIADLLIIQGVLGLAERFFGKNSSRCEKDK